MHLFMRVAIASMAVALITGCGLTAPSDNAGYLAFAEPSHPGVSRHTNLSLGPRVLRFAAKYTEDDPQARAILENVQGIRVNIYSIDTDADKASIHEAVVRNSESAFDASWRPVIRVESGADSGTEAVYLYVKENESTLLGLGIVALDEEELVFVNLMGSVHEDQLTALASELPQADLFD